MKSKIISLTVLLSVLTACTSQYNVNQFYDKYQGSENSISFKAPMFLASLMLQNNPELRGLTEKIKSIKFLTLSELNESKYNSVKTDMQTALQKDGFDDWFTMNKHGLQVNISTQSSGKAMKNLVVALQGEEELMLLNAKTDLSEQELTQFISAIIDKKESK